MKYEDLIAHLLNKFPELQNKYDEDKFYLGSLPHLVFESLFVKFIIELYEKEDTKKLIEALDLINDMLVSDDIKIREVAVVSVLEPLLPERTLIETIRPYLKKESKESFEELEEKYGWNNHCETEA